MLNPELKLNNKPEGIKTNRSTREGFGDALVLEGEKNKNIVVLTADLKESTQVHKFAEKFPERFFEVGVAEQNLITIAAGLGISGKIPFATSYAIFSPGRNWEQIRTCISYNDSNVKIVGSHAGITVGADGATHQALEDIALMRVLPNMKIFSPCDVIEAEKMTSAASHIHGPVYLRLSRDKTPVITTDETPFVPGKIKSFWISERPQCAIFATGPILSSALSAAKKLKSEGIQVMVLNVHTIKPLDEKAIVSAAKRSGSVVTVEEHQIAGGLGGAISEVLAREFPAPIEFVGMNDSFGESGSPKELLKKYNLDTEDIVRAIKKVISRK